MTVCYAIASGEYSDYQVFAIFTTKEKAEAELFKYGPDAFIEELPLDPVTPEWPTGFHLFRCLGFSSGQAHAYRANLSHSDVAFDLSCFQVQRVPQYTTGYKRHCKTQHRTTKCKFKVCVIARDEEHAVKIAAEKFAKADAIQAGIAL